MPRNPLIALLILPLFAIGLSRQAGAESAYVPIRQTIAGGTYHAPNYLHAVNTSIGRQSAYQLFSNVVGEKYPHNVGRFGKNETLVRALQRQRTRRPLLLGLYAEERFVNQKAGWQKVNNPLAPQRDVWRRVNGRVQYGQIKVHGLGRTAPTMQALASTYLQSMRKDSGRGQASIFLVPDDHIDGVLFGVN